MEEDNHRRRDLDNTNVSLQTPAYRPLMDCMGLKSRSLLSQALPGLYPQMAPVRVDILGDNEGADRTGLCV